MHLCWPPEAPLRSISQTTTTRDARISEGKARVGRGSRKSREERKMSHTQNQPQGMTVEGGKMPPKYT